MTTSSPLANCSIITYLVHNPSLVQHQGHVSSRPEAQDPSSGAYRYGHMKAQTYRGDDFDCLNLLGEQP